MFRRVKLARVVPEPAPASPQPTQAGALSPEAKLKAFQHYGDKIDAARIKHRAGGDGMHAAFAFEQAKKYNHGTRTQQIAAPMASAALGRVAKLQAMYKKGQLAAQWRFGIAA